MSPFKLRSVKKALKKIDLSEKDANYFLLPFIENWNKENPTKLGYLSKSSELPFKEWKDQVHGLVGKKLKLIEPLPLDEQDFELHGKAEANGIKFIKFSLMALPGVRIPAIMCIPEKISGRVPGMITIHGHGQSLANTAGFKRSKSKEYFGYELAKKGIVTISPDWLGSGEREKFRKKFLLFFQDEGYLSNWVRFLGLDMIGLRVAEMQGLINYLETRDEINPDRIGIMGHSGGGTLSLFTTIIDERIKLCATSGYFGSWKHSILAKFHCGCNYIPDLGTFVEMYDLYASLAPTPLAITIGQKDKIFRYEGTQRAIPIIQQAYKGIGASENFLSDVHPKGHLFRGDNIYPFILKHIF